MPEVKQPEKPSEQPEKPVGTEPDEPIFSISTIQAMQKQVDV